MQSLQELATKAGNAFKSVRNRFTLSMPLTIAAFVVGTMGVNFLLGAYYWPGQIGFGHTQWGYMSTWAWLFFGEFIMLAALVADFVVVDWTLVVAVFHAVVGWAVAALKVVAGFAVWAAGIALIGGLLYLLKIDRLWEYAGNLYAYKQRVPLTPVIDEAASVSAVPPVRPEPTVAPVPPAEIPPVTVGPHASAHHAEAGDYPFAPPATESVQANDISVAAHALPETDPPSIRAEQPQQPEPPPADQAPAAAAPETAEEKPGPHLVTDNVTKPDEPLSKAS